MPYRSGDQGAYFEPKNKPPSSLNNTQKSQKLRKNDIVDSIFFRKVNCRGLRNLLEAEAVGPIPTSPDTQTVWS